MIFVTGSNLFGQWLCDKNIFTEFCVIGNDFNQAKLVNICWSHNLFSIKNTYYLSGSWTGKDNQLKKLRLPAVNDELNRISVISNDQYLVLVNMTDNMLWIIDPETENIQKKINLNTETPVQDNAKKRKENSEIKKVVAKNDMFLYLTSTGNIYSCILPSYINTEHCVGDIIDIQCGYEHYILLTNVGRVYTWGNGRRLQLGHGDISNLDNPTELEALAGIKILKITAGGWHTLALSEFGDVYAWGWNDTGQLGIREKDSLNIFQSYGTPKVVEFFDDNNTEVNMNVIDIACGSRHSAVVLQDNTVWTTGYNKYGQLGFSNVIHPTIQFFKKSFSCIKSSKVTLMGGHWSTVLITEDNK